MNRISEVEASQCHITLPENSSTRVGPGFRTTVPEHPYLPEAPSISTCRCICPSLPKGPGRSEKMGRGKNRRGRSWTARPPVAAEVAVAACSQHQLAMATILRGGLVETTSLAAAGPHQGLRVDASLCLHSLTPQCIDRLVRRSRYGLGHVDDSSPLLTANA